jgi:hypothetical protein
VPRASSTMIVANIQRTTFGIRATPSTISRKMRGTNKEEWTTLIHNYLNVSIAPGILESWGVQPNSLGVCHAASQ